MGGQGARRKRNWRHNQLNSPYRRMRMLQTVPPPVPTLVDPAPAVTPPPGPDSDGNSDTGGGGDVTTLPPMTVSEQATRRRTGS